MHVTNVCNLTCESCSHYSNHGHKGHVEPEQAEEWFKAWSGRISVGDFLLLGGEPTVHPHLAEFVPLVRKHWPKAKITIVTNGFFLDRHPDLPRALARAGNSELALSIHHPSPEYRQRIQPNVDLIARWQAEHGISHSVWDSQSTWTRRYLSFGDDMQPFEDGNPRESWRICPARECKQLFEGKLWKCSPITYLRLQQRQFKLSPKWESYLKYEPLAATCDDRALAAFLRREDEGICSMCPSHRREFKLPNPMKRAARSLGESPVVA